MNADWVKDAKDALRENCNLDAITTMGREEIGNVLSSQITFRDTFRKQESHPQQDHQAVREEIPVREEAKLGISM